MTHTDTYIRNMLGLLPKATSDKFLARLEKGENKSDIAREIQDFWSDTLGLNGGSGFFPY